jgi:hypothetical protein
MVKHVVMYTLKDNSPESCAKVRKMLLSMDGKVPEIREIIVGIDYLRSERSYDMVLEVMVDDREALEVYQNNAYHVGTVKPFMHAARSGSVAVDFEF